MLCTLPIIVGCAREQGDESLLRLSGRIQHGDTLAYLERAKYFLRLDRILDAQRDLNELINLGRGTEEVYQLRAAVSFTLGRFDYAALDFSECIRLGNHTLLPLRAKSYFREGEYKDAVGDLEKSHAPFQIRIVNLFF